MYQPLWQVFRPVVARTEPGDVVPSVPTTPQNVLDHDRAYVNAHPELYSLDYSSRFHYDRAPLPSEWSGELPSGCYVRVYVINAWSIVRVLHSAEGTRLQAPVIDTWVNDIAA